MKKYPFLSVWSNVISKVLSYNDRWADTEEAKIYNSIEDYEKRLEEEFGYYDIRTGRFIQIAEIIKNSQRMQDDYNLISGYLRNGYSIAEKSVSYHDDYIRDEIAVLSRDNPNFIVLKCDD